MSRSEMLLGMISEIEAQAQEQNGDANERADNLGEEEAFDTPGLS